MITQEQANRFHKAARMIELDGAEGYFTCRDKFGADVAGMALIMWARCHIGHTKDEYPSAEVHEQRIDEVNAHLVEAGRMTDEGSSD